MMGYRTPNIDRVAAEGMRFTDYYAEQSCTAGRASFILGQSVFRSGLSKVGLPGAELGSNEEDPTIARLLKKGMEDYSKSPEGAAYTFSWTTDKKLPDGSVVKEKMKCPMNLSV